MPVEQKNTTQKKKRKRGSGVASTAVGRAGSMIVRIIIACFFVLCLFGVINQAVFGQKFYDWIIETGQKVGQVMSYILQGDPNAPVEVTDQGVYIKGHSPEGSKNLAEEMREQAPTGN